MSEHDAAAIAADLDTTGQLAVRDQTILALTHRIDELLGAARAANSLLETGHGRVGELEALLGAKDREIASLRETNGQLSDELTRRPPAPAPKQLAVKLTAPHGFIEEATGVNRVWQMGQVVTNPDEIALLRNRGAPIENV